MAAAISTDLPGRHRKPVSAIGDLLVIVFEITLSGSYVAGGEVINTTLQNLLKVKGNGKIFVVDLENFSGYQFSYNSVTGKLMIHQGDNTNAAAAPGIELPAAAYPAALTARTIQGFCLGL